MNPKRSARQRWFDGLFRKAGKSQARVAKEIRVDKAAMSRIVSGYRELSLVEGYWLAKALGISVGRLARHIAEDDLFQ